MAATGAAFLLIHRSALKAMAERNFNEAFPFFQETQNGDKPVSEDLTFCLRLASLGIPVHVHSGVKIGHHKTYVITEVVPRSPGRTDGVSGRVRPRDASGPHLRRCRLRHRRAAVAAAAVALIDHYLGFDIGPRPTTAGDIAVCTAVGTRIAAQWFTNPQDRASYNGVEGMSWQAAPQMLAAHISASRPDRVARPAEQVRAWDRLMDVDATVSGAEQFGKGHDANGAAQLGPAAAVRQPDRRLLARPSGAVFTGGKVGAAEPAQCESVSDATRRRRWWTPASCVTSPPVHPVKATADSAKFGIPRVRSVSGRGP